MTASSVPQLDQAPFHNSFVDELRADPLTDRQPRQVPGYHYSRVLPTPVAAPQLLAWADDVAALLGVARPAPGSRAEAALAGNLVTDAMRPFAARYGGHQFGSWAGQLGDGRAMSLGELTGTDGRRWELQLKGAGPTPYSRRADGRAVLRSSVREFLCSEAMHALGVPTTRALSLVATGDAVVRDMFYDGHARPEPGAIVARVAPTFVRFGNFQLLTATGEIDNLRELADYVLRHHFPALGPPSPETYAQWFGEVCRRTAELVAHWQSVGFVHGVLNTDNMSILGLTIDYGPYGWLEPYDPGWTPNTTDFGQYRYAFGQQPQVALWNLAQLGSALTPLVPDVASLSAGLEVFRQTFTASRQQRLRAKLGLVTEQANDAALLADLHQVLAMSEMDMTVFFRRLAQRVPDLLGGPAAADAQIEALLAEASYLPADSPIHARLRTWLGRYVARLAQEPAAAAATRAAMLAVNPKYVLRNYLAQQAAEAAEAGDLAPLHRLYAVLQQPFAEQPEHEALAARRPDWARDKPGAATLSCSS